MAKSSEDNVLSILTSIKRSQNSSDEPSEDPDEVTSLPSKSGDKKEKVDVRGKPKSGRFWKTKKERFSTVNKTKGLKNDFQKKTALRIDLKRTKELSKQVQEELKQKELDRKERRRENIKRSQENKQKSEIVQVITNTAKLKRLRKKQLRFIQKRDTNKEVEASK